MKTSSRSTLRPCWRHLASAFLACAAALSAPCALADVIDFEQIVNHTSPAGNSVYVGGDTFSTGGYLAVVANSAYAQSFPDLEPGLAGVTIAAGDSGACLWLACPFPITQHYAGLNDGSLTLSREDETAFRLSSLSFGGIANENEEGSALSFGQLRITGTRLDGTTVTTATDFPELHYWSEWTLDAAFAATAFTSITIDACTYIGGAGTRLDGSTLSATADFPGLYEWREWTLDAAFAATAFTRITIDACTYTAGECLNGEETLNLSQFALDDVHVSAVPEPSTVVLLTAGLLLVAARRLGGRA